MCICLSMIYIYICIYIYSIYMNVIVCRCTWTYSWHLYMYVHLETSSGIPGISIHKNPSHLARLLVIRRYQLRQNICKTKPRRNRLCKNQSDKGNQRWKREWETTECLAAQQCSSSIWPHSTGQNSRGKRSKDME